MTSPESNTRNGKAVYFIFENYWIKFYYASDDETPVRFPNKLEIFFCTPFSVKLGKADMLRHLAIIIGNFD